MNASNNVLKKIRRWAGRLAGAAVTLHLVAMSSPAFAVATDLAGAMNNLVTYVAAAAAGFIALSCIKWGIEYLQGDRSAHDAFMRIGIGAGLILGAATLATQL
ncbi:MAG: TrbC/VirB2 family protein [Acidobacteriota bacterium]